MSTGIRTQQEAYLVEASLIDALARHVAPLTNVVRGHDTGTGLVTLEELEMRLAAPPLETSEPAVLIKLGYWKVFPDELPGPATATGQRCPSVSCMTAPGHGG